jgi:serine protease Do
MKENEKKTKGLKLSAVAVAAAFVVGCASGTMLSSKNLTESDSPTSAESKIAAESISLSDARETLTATQIAQRVGPAVVGIQCSVSVKSVFGTQKGTSSGSGIIFKDDGYIVTNYHVIENASDITVILNTGEEIEAKLIGGDSKTDLAVLKIDTDIALTAATFGDSDEMQPGDSVVAIGNPLGMELFGTVTAGIISGVNRTVEVDDKEMTLLQTDAAINSGNSGGALINCYGEVIGINSAKISSDVSEGLGFAIPSNEATPIISDLMTVGYVQGRPLIGLGLREITREIAYYNNLSSNSGLYVMSVSEGSGAEAAGIQRGDIVLAIDGKSVTSLKELNAVRDTHKAGESVVLQIDRSGEMMDVQVTLGEDRN